MRQFKGNQRPRLLPKHKRSVQQDQKAAIALQIYKTFGKELHNEANEIDNQEIQDSLIIPYRPKKEDK